MSRPPPPVPERRSPSGSAAPPDRTDSSGTDVRERPAPTADEKSNDTPAEGVTPEPEAPVPWVRDRPDLHRDREPGAPRRREDPVLPHGPQRRR